MENLLKTFFDNIVNQYKKAVEITEPFKREGTIRGRQHSISSIAEDIFAALLFDCLREKYPTLPLQVLIDYPIRPNGEGLKMLPDVAIVINWEQPVLVSYLDLKTDLGFKRHYYEHLPVIKDLVLRLRSADHAGTEIDGSSLVINRMIKWRTVVISDTNMSSATLLQRNKEDALLYRDVFSLYFLSGVRHPNVKERSEIEIYSDVFKQLIDDLSDDIDQARLSTETKVKGTVEA